MRCGGSLEGWCILECCFSFGVSLKWEEEMTFKSRLDSFKLQYERKELSEHEFAERIIGLYFLHYPESRKGMGMGDGSGIGKPSGSPIHKGYVIDHSSDK